MEPKVLRREQRICFRADYEMFEEVRYIGGEMALPRSAVCYLLVALGVWHLRQVSSRGEFWAGLAVLPVEVQQAAMRQEKAPCPDV